MNDLPTLLNLFLLAEILIDVHETLATVATTARLQGLTVIRAEEERGVEQFWSVKLFADTADKQARH